MGLDSRNKRASAAQQGLILELLPNPDGAIDQPDRQQCAWCYSGIPASAISYTSIGPSFVYKQIEIPGLTFELEVFIRATTGTVKARLYDVTLASPVSSSEVSLTNTSFDLVRSSGSLVLVEGNKYQTQIGKVAGDAGEIKGSTVLGFS